MKHFFRRYPYLTFISALVAVVGFGVAKMLAIMPH